MTARGQTAPPMAIRTDSSFRKMSPHLIFFLDSPTQTLRNLTSSNVFTQHSGHLLARSSSRQLSTILYVTPEFPARRGRGMNGNIQGCQRISFEISLLRQF